MHEKKNACLRAKALERARIGAKPSEITALACRACDREIVEAATTFFAANKHRYMEPNLNDIVRRERGDCLRVSEFASTAVLAAAEEIVDRVKYLSSGAWHVEAQVRRDGLLSYMLIGVDTKAAFSIELRCYPAYGSGNSLIRGPYKRSDAVAYATYSIDTDSLKQLRVSSVRNGEVAFLLDGNIWAQIRKATKTFHISVQSAPATFEMFGFVEAEADWLRRCVG